MTKANAFIKDHEAESRKIIGEFAKVPADLLMKIALPEFQTAATPGDLDVVLNLVDEFGFLARFQAKRADAKTMLHQTNAP